MDSMDLRGRFTSSPVLGYKVFVPDYTGLNESYISERDRELTIPDECVVLPPGVYACQVCGKTLIAAASSVNAISKFPYAPTGCTTLGGYVWWKIVGCCDKKYLIKNEGRG
jgi:hypothetical protein